MLTIKDNCISIFLCLVMQKFSALRSLHAWRNKSQQELMGRKLFPEKSCLARLLLELIFLHQVSLTTVFSWTLTGSAAHDMTSPCLHGCIFRFIFSSWVYLHVFTLEKAIPKKWKPRTTMVVLKWVYFRVSEWLPFNFVVIGFTISVVCWPL